MVTFKDPDLPAPTNSNYKHDGAAVYRTNEQNDNVIKNVYDLLKNNYQNETEKEHNIKIDETTKIINKIKNIFNI